MSNDSWKSAYELGVLQNLHQRVFGRPAPEYTLPEDVIEKCLPAMRERIQGFVRQREVDGLCDRPLLNVVRVLADDDCPPVVRLGVAIDFAETWKLGAVQAGLQVEDVE